MEEYIEKEIKLKIDNIEGVVDTLRRNGAIFIGGALERTIRFDTTAQDYEKQGKFLRVRSGFSNTITLKEKIKSSNNNVRERKETEFEIEDIDKMCYILGALGLDYTRTMEKYRQHWKLDNCSITLDELPFGIFMEIEGEESEIYKICDKLGLDKDKKILVTYWELWAEITDNKDIIFDSDYKFRLI